MRLDELKKILINYKNALSCIEYLKYKNLYASNENKLIVKILNKTIDKNYNIIQKYKEYLIIPAKVLQNYIQEEYRLIYPNDNANLYYTQYIKPKTYYAGSNTYVEYEYYDKLTLSHTKEHLSYSTTLLLSREFCPMSKEKRNLNKYISIADIIRTYSSEIDEIINRACWKILEDKIKSKYSLSNIDDSILI